MRHGSLFSGIGGFDLAAAWLGWENVFQVEIDPFCREVLQQHFPDTVRYRDIRKFNAEKYHGTIEIISGGFPCQPFSLAGKRIGSEDDRYLWPEMLRIINAIRPTWVVGENVAGITSMVQPGVSVKVDKQAALWEKDQAFFEECEFITETICKDFERIGYTIQPVLIPACAVGTWHRRDRIWFLAYTDSGGCQRGDLSYGQGTKRSFIAFPAWLRTFDLHEIGQHILSQPGCIRSYDGFSRTVVSREIRGFGNAIVPQVAFELFQAIDRVSRRGEQEGC